VTPFHHGEHEPICVAVKVPWCSETMAFSLPRRRRRGQAGPQDFGLTPARHHGLALRLGDQCRPPYPTTCRHPAPGSTWCVHPKATCGAHICREKATCTNKYARMPVQVSHGGALDQQPRDSSSARDGEQVVSTRPGGLLRLRGSPMPRPTSPGWPGAVPPQSHNLHREDGVR
jgi:hypothetical protein